MNLTKEQKKYIGIGIAVVAIYYAPSLIMSVRRMAYLNAAQQRAAQMSTRRQVAPKTEEAQKTAASLSAADVAASHLTGVWSGRKITAETVCKVGLEIRPLEAGSYSGFLKISCGSLRPKPGIPGVNSGIGAALSEFDPTSVILTGTVAGGALLFAPEQDPASSVKAQPVADTAAGGETEKPITAVEARPFGNNAISVTWQEDHKPAGQILLTKERG